MTKRVNQAQAAVDAALAELKAANDAQEAATKKLDGARKELRMAKIDADKDLPRVIVRTRGRFVKDDQGAEYVVHKRTAKSITVRAAGSDYTRQFRPAKSIRHAGEWHEYPEPKGWSAPISWIDVPQEVEK